MMGLGRERRLNCRLYVDRQADATVVGKLDRLLEEKHFLNQTELIKHGIELVYREVYEQENIAEKVAVSGMEMEKLAEMVADVLKPELQQMLAGFEARFIDGIAAVNASIVVKRVDGEAAVVEGVAFTEDVIKSAGVEQERKQSTEVPEEKVLSGSAISFLKGLNDD